MADLNPVEWPRWLQFVAGWGPLAAGWIWAELRRAREATAHHETRDENQKSVEKIHAEHDAAVAKIHDEYASSLAQKSKEYGEQVKQMAEANRDQVKQMADDHRQQMTALLDRCMKLVEQQSTAVADLLDAVKRRRT